MLIMRIVILMIILILIELEIGIEIEIGYVLRRLFMLHMLKGYIHIYIYI